MPFWKYVISLLGTRILTHFAVLLLTASREFNLKCRDVIWPDVNKHCGSLCNPSVAISTQLFGDYLNKEVEEVTKFNKLSSKVTSKQRSNYRFEPYKLSCGRGIRGGGRFPQATSPTAFDQCWSNFGKTIQQNDPIDFSTNWFANNVATTYVAAISINVNIYMLTDQILAMIFRVSGVTCTGSHFILTFNT